MAKNTSDRLSACIHELGGWRGKTLARSRRLILDAAPDLVEGWTWNMSERKHTGNVITLGSTKDHAKFNMLRGASMRDTHNVLNAGLESKASRAIDVVGNDKIDQAAFCDLFSAATLDRGGAKPSRRSNP